MRRRLGKRSFNGATADQPWRVELPEVNYGGNIGFNGATADQPWRVYEMSKRPSPVAASMGPRLISRGEPTPTTGYSGPWLSFNGATADQPWRAERRVDPLEKLRASMGPRLISRGEARADAA